MNPARIGISLVLLLFSALPSVAQPLVDHHQHLFSSSTAERSPSLAALDAARLIELLDAAGIGRAAVLSVAYQLGGANRPRVDDEYGKVRAENDWTSQQAWRSWFTCARRSPVRARMERSWRMRSSAR
jgi:hypothetical protein